MRIVKAEIELPRHALLAWSTRLVDGRPRVLHVRSLIVRWRRRSSESHNWHKIDCHGNVSRGIEKGISSRSSAAYLMKIGPVDVEIIGLTEITEK